MPCTHSRLQNNHNWTVQTLAMTLSNYFYCFSGVARESVARKEQNKRAGEEGKICFGRVSTALNRTLIHDKFGNIFRGWYLNRTLLHRAPREDWGAGSRKSGDPKICFGTGVLVHEQGQGQDLGKLQKTNWWGVAFGEGSCQKHTKGGQHPRNGKRGSKMKIGEGRLPVFTCQN